MKTLVMMRNGEEGMKSEVGSLKSEWNFVKATIILLTSDFRLLTSDFRPPTSVLLLKHQFLHFLFIFFFILKIEHGAEDVVP